MAAEAKIEITNKTDKTGVVVNFLRLKRRFARGQRARAGSHRRPLFRIFVL
jgi:hypothetical protein